MLELDYCLVTEKQLCLPGMAVMADHPAVLADHTVTDAFDAGHVAFIEQYRVFKERPFDN